MYNVGLTQSLHPGSLFGKTDFAFFLLSLLFLEFLSYFHIYQTFSVLLSLQNNSNLRRRWLMPENREGDLKNN
jgi:hypothetical protein